MIPRPHFATTDNGFTLVELLVVAAIIGILISMTLLGFANARKTQRDTDRKTSLELIRSKLELYRADCDQYPTTLSTPLVGDGSSQGCSVSTVYMDTVPTDPLSPTRDYIYYSDGINYELCASLEHTAGSTVTCGSTSACGSETCNYKTTNP